MGWAKYYEDNVEIMYERQATMQSHKQETEINIVYTGISPTANIIVETKEELIVPQRPEFKDRHIVCKDCGRKLLFSAKS